MAEKTYTRAVKWKGNDLEGTWRVTLKIDGVRAFRSGDGYVSRSGKPLYNIPVLRDMGSTEGYEVYAWDPNRTSVQNYIATIEAVRAKNKPERMLKPKNLYRLGPLFLDRRLDLGEKLDPTADWINAAMAHALSTGYEGLVLYGPKGVWLKVKPVETYDVRITGFIAGTGKHKGRLGAVTTTMGKVGTGFSDALRQEIWNNQGEWWDALIEVGAMSLTKDGKFRMPRFIRRREDKDESDA